MSLQTVSTKRDRVYQRRFDHDLAREMRAEGTTYSEIARQLGVSAAAVRRVCDPEVNERMSRAALEHSRRNRQPCLGGCGRLVWTHMNGSTRPRTGYCAECFQARRNAERDDIGEESLRCHRCGNWKVDAEFPRNRQGPARARRGRYRNCRTCENAIRNEHRRRKPEITAEADRRRYIKRRKNAMTGYVVLRPTEDGNYEQVGRVDAVSPTHAIETLVSEPGQFCAIKESALKVFKVGQVQSFRVLPEAEAVRAVA